MIDVNLMAPCFYVQKKMAPCFFPNKVNEIYYIKTYHSIIF